MEIMTAAHPRWEEFLARLDRTLPEQQNSCGHNFARTMEALADMGGFDSFNTVEYLQECDITMETDNEKAQHRWNSSWSRVLDCGALLTSVVAKECGAFP